jgi:hypothetical protein
LRIACWLPKATKTHSEYVHSLACQFLMWFTTTSCILQKKSMWDLWWTKWHRDRFCSEFFDIPVTIFQTLLHAFFNGFLTVHHSVDLNLSPT